jgi:hypothetical protein
LDSAYNHYCILFHGHDACLREFRKIRFLV